MLKKYLPAAALAALIFLAISVASDIYYYNKVKMPPQDGPWQIAYSDFRVYWTTARDFRLRYANDTAYGPIDRRYASIYDFGKEFYHFRYSPFAAYAFVPFGMLPMGFALLVWSGLSNLFYLVSAALVAFLFGKMLAVPPDRRVPAAVMAVALNMVFYLNNIALGQTDILVMFLLSLFLLFYSRRSDIAAAVTFSLILHFKPFFFPALAYFFVSGRRKMVYCSVLAFAAFLAVPMVRPGYAREILYINGEWVRIVIHSVSGQISNPKNRSFVYLALKMARPHEAASLACAVSAACYAALLFLLLAIRRKAMRGPESPRRRSFAGFEVSYLILSTLLTSPLIWKASFVYCLMPLCLVILSLFREDKKKGLYLFIGIYSVLNLLMSSDAAKWLAVSRFLGAWPVAAGALFLFVWMAAPYARIGGYSDDGA